jgi:hypothetical protein
MLEQLVIYYAQLPGTVALRSSIPYAWLIKAVFKNFARNMMTVFTVIITLVFRTNLNHDFTEVFTRKHTYK